MTDERKFKLAAGNPHNIVELPRVRVTVLTPRLFRLEWSEDGKFEDRQTLAVVRRDLGEVNLKISKSSNGCVIDTGAAVVKLSGDGKPFSRENLAVTFPQGGKKKVWTPDLKPDGNLLGSYRTLDCCEGSEKLFNSNIKGAPPTRTPIPLSLGLISRDGWSLIDDSQSVVIDSKNREKWVAPRPESKRLDWYLFAYGHDFSEALCDGAKVFGAQPLVPRYALGYWWSRYWAYSDLEIEDLVTGFDRADVPIDVMVVDMDWHLEGWTGYTWDHRYFPDPDDFLAHLHERGLKVSLNLHPAEGVGKHEEAFPKMARAMKLDPEKIDRVPFDITDPKYMKNYFKILHHPEEKRGVDFWWMDWQQGKSTTMSGLDALPWINQLHWEDMLGRKDKKRPLIFSRFGGIGAGRYAIGFSGDTYSTWKSLAYQPYFTSTASNVLYGYWSHDIGGHMPGKVDGELYLRWLQFGAYSPILRTHTTKNVEAERRIWRYQEPFSDIMADTIRLRYSLVPYIYSEFFRAHETGMSLCRPLYYIDPEDDRCYNEPGEYLFGGEMLLAPVTSPVNPESELAEKEVYLPAGDWYDTVFQTFESGRQALKRKYRLDEIPVFVRAGAILPGLFNCRRLNDRCYENLSVTAYPGKAGSYQLYEDDGISTDYTKGRYALISLSQRTEGKCRSVNVVHKEGNYKGFEKHRTLEIRMPGCVPPEKISVNGKSVPWVYRFSDAEKKPQWRYDGANAEILIRIPRADLDHGVELKAHFASEKMFAPASGAAATFRRLRQIGGLHNSLSSWPLSDSDERLGQMLSHAAVRISLHPESFDAEMALVKAKLPDLIPEIKKLAQAIEKDKPEYQYKIINEKGAAAVKKAEAILRESGLI